MRDLIGNIRYALRQFRSAPVFTAAAVLTLALGIGGTTAIFTLIDAVMLRSLPVADPGRLYRVGDGDDCCVEGGPQDRWGMFSFPLYERLKAEAPEFEDVAAFQTGRGQLSVRREEVESAARPLRSEYVTGNYFAVLGIGSFGGRVFTANDDRPAAPPVAVLSHRTWQGIYGGDATVVGATFVIEGHPFTVIGVAPPGFFGETVRSDPPDIWIPLQQEPMIAAGSGSLLRQSVSAWLRMIGRARPGATITGMGPRLTGVLRQWMVNDSGYPSNWMADVQRLLPKQVINVVPAGAGVAEMKEEYGRSLQILLSVCGLVLLIACANVANLLLARGVARRGQIAVRMAVGATRSEIVKQALTESVLLAIGGAIAGLWWRWLRRGCCWHLRFTARIFCRSAPGPHCWFWRSRLRWRWLRELFLARHRRGLRRERIRLTLCAGRDAARAIGLRSRARRYCWCRRLFRLYWWRARRCWGAA